jgi:hypothetical protein
MIIKNEKYLLYQPIYIRCFIAQEKQPAHLEHNTQFVLTIPLVVHPTPSGRRGRSKRNLNSWCVSAPTSQSQHSAARTPEPPLTALLLHRRNGVFLIYLLYELSTCTCLLTPVHPLLKLPAWPRPFDDCAFGVGASSVGTAGSFKYVIRWFHGVVCHSDPDFCVNLASSVRPCLACAYFVLGRPVASSKCSGRSSQ